jgi:predicted hotdog family 3-hydroxylacyl-ACP dehydratase
MLLNKENITKIIPQQHPFVMVDNLIIADKTGFKSTFKVLENNIFLIDGKLQEPALIENIAQTVAAGFGFIDNLNNENPKIGYIGGISKLKIYNLPELGREIETSIVHQYQFENIHLVKGQSYSNGEMLMECEMKIVVQE